MQQFALEAKELLQAIEQSLIALEASPRKKEDGNETSADELLNRIFGAGHTIQGTSAFLGLETVARLSHGARTCLAVCGVTKSNSVREPQPLFSPRVINSAA